MTLFSSLSMAKQHCVTDHRNVKLHAVEDRWAPIGGMGWDIS